MTLSTLMLTLSLIFLTLSLIFHACLHYTHHLDKICRITPTRWFKSRAEVHSQRYAPHLSTHLDRESDWALIHLSIRWSLNTVVWAFIHFCWFQTLATRRLNPPNFQLRSFSVLVSSDVLKLYLNSKSEEMESNFSQILHWSKSQCFFH